ncbi:hypothetical protein EW145_g4322 [Phellinidium pouzarii]|uniref:Protein kinase domain-containing protein n=1 Tax=Phellinidium pouzarii TaxID=167371 RepID=A0A4S4L3X5_9AGAM|nr:hypothetical protein EW145_g4322 [Phellinidium pouzarii]
MDKATDRRKSYKSPPTELAQSQQFRRVQAFEEQKRVRLLSSAAIYRRSLEVLIASLQQKRSQRVDAARQLDQFAGLSLGVSSDEDDSDDAFQSGASRVPMQGVAHLASLLSTIDAEPPPESRTPSPYPEQGESKTKVKKKNKSKGKKKPNKWANKCMYAELLEMREGPLWTGSQGISNGTQHDGIPDDLETAWVGLAPIPVGKRCLAVTMQSAGVSGIVPNTILRSRLLGKVLIHPFPSPLPPNTILDCILDENWKTNGLLHVLDVVRWKNQDVGECEASFRFWWRDTRLSEMPVWPLPPPHKSSFSNARISTHPVYRFPYPTTFVSVPYITPISLEILLDEILSRARNGRDMRLKIPVLLDGSSTRDPIGDAEEMQIDYTSGQNGARGLWSADRIQDVDVPIRSDGLFLYVGEASYEAGESPLSVWVPRVSYELSYDEATTSANADANGKSAKESPLDSFERRAWEYALFGGLWSMALALAHMNARDPQTANHTRASVLPPAQRNPRILVKHLPVKSLPRNLMLAVPPPIDLTYDSDSDWLPPSKAVLHRTASVGNSWGVTSIGGGYSWSEKQNIAGPPCELKDEVDLVPFTGSFIEPDSPRTMRSFARQTINTSKATRLGLSNRAPNHAPVRDDESQLPGSPVAEPVLSESPLSRSPFSSSAVSLTSLSTTSETLSPNHTGEVGSSSRPSLTRSPTMPRPRRRSSQQRVSLTAGRLSILSIDPPSESSLMAPKLSRSGSQSSFMSASSAAPPSPAAEKESFLGGRSISEFVIEGELGRGAYGLVKRAREMNVNGETGPPVIIKQIIKSRILADCWKRHPKFGTIPVEIYVMSSISSASYVLPPKRPWDPSRNYLSSQDDPDPWIDGKVVKGHPSICQLLDFFEDNHFYYLVMPSTVPETKSDGISPPSDLFDLVEGYPQGLPPNLVRSYLGQIADALAFLHAKGIVHRDVKDENVVLGRKPGSCILIDFGSSGIVKRNGWDTFSGTLDYAGPEILRGERYHGKEQDVWAFGVVAFVLLIGECPFNTAAEAQEGLESPFSNASIVLDERCGDDKENSGEEADGGGRLGDAAALVRACLRIDLTARPTFEKILTSRFLSGGTGWSMDS